MFERTSSGKKILPQTKDEVCELDKWSRLLKEYEGGTAFLREDKVSGRKFVVKSFDRWGKNMSPQMWVAERRAYERIELFRTVATEFTGYIAGYYGYVECSPAVQYLFTEWVGDVPLQEVLLQKASKEQEKLHNFWVNLLHDLSNVVLFLEGLGVNHRDFHPGNIHYDDETIKVFDFGLSVGAKMWWGITDPPWTVTDWGGNWMGEFTNSKFVLGFDLHDFFVGLLVDKKQRQLVPDAIIRELIFPVLKDLSAEEQKEYDALEWIADSYEKIGFEEQSKIVPNNLKSDWKPTSGEAYKKFLVKSPLWKKATQTIDQQWHYKRTQYQEDGNDLETYTRAIAVPRAPGTAGHRKVREFIVRTLLWRRGWKVETQVVRVRRRQRATLEFRNIVATRGGPGKSCIVLAAHYDSKTAYTGAADAAASCAILLWLAKNLKKNQRQMIRLVFFDGEEALGREPWTRRNTLWGSRALSWAWSQTGEINHISLFVLLDLIGSRRGGTALYSFWPRTESHLRRLSEIDAAGGIFRVGEKPPVGTVEDDHLPFLEKDVPVLHLISVPFPRTWHTDEDTPETIDYAVVRRVALALRIFCEEQRDVSKQQIGLRFADPLNTIVITVPHAIESETEKVATQAALCLSRHLGRRSLLMDNWQTRRTECDANRKKCRHRLRYRENLRKVVRSMDVSMVIDMHSSSNLALQGHELAILDHVRPPPYALDFLGKMVRKRVDVWWFRSIDNDIMKEMRTEFSRRALVLEFNESMPSPRLEVVCREVANWLRTV